MFRALVAATRSHFRPAQCSRKGFNRLPTPDEPTQETTQKEDVGAK
jgi:hypothetical protein